MPDRSETPRHGGDLTFASCRYGIPADGWLDLSTGINPHSYPAKPVGRDAFECLPGSGALGHLLTAGATAYEVPEGAAIAAVPGTELAIRLLPSIVPAGTAAVLAPGYSSHADAFRLAGRTVVPLADIEAVPGDVAAVLLGNPNNPDGGKSDPVMLARLANRLADRGALLIVDEAFADVTPDLSLMPMLDRVPALVLRSFGKFFGLPGLRLGFAAGPPSVVDALVARIGAWPINSAAIAIGSMALADAAWQQAMRHQLAEEMAEMRKNLTDHDLTVVGGTDLFVLIENDAAVVLHDGLARRGIWTRWFPEAPHRLRLGLAPPGQASERLAAALAAVTPSN